MKRIIFIIALIVFMGLQSLPVFAAAADAPKQHPVDVFLPPDEVARPRGYLQGAAEGTPLTGKNLKTEILPRAINLVLALVTTMSMGVFIYSGIMLIIAQGNEEEVTKFKTTLLWSLVGLAFITTSYGIVRGVLQVFFK